VTWLWALGALAPFGIATPALFGVAGRQVGKRSWLVAAAVYAVLAWGGVVLAIATEDDSGGRTFSGLMILSAWIGGAVHAFVARGEYARRLAGPRRTALDAARETVAERREAQELVRREPLVALQMGVGRPDVPGAAHMHVIDVNRAHPRELAALPGVNLKLAREIVRAREEIDGFDSLEDLGIVMHLDGNAVEDLRPYVVFIPR
jgi:DNA uptake protein ComE-like DNA-binding protein